MNRNHIGYATCLATMFVGAVIIQHPVGWVSFLVVLAFTAGKAQGERGRVVLEDRLGYFEHRVVDHTGDLGHSLEREVRMLRRRLAGLIANPAIAERAHRIVAPLGLEPGELTGELEAVEQGASPFWWPGLEDAPAAERAPVA